MQPQLDFRPFYARAQASGCGARSARDGFANYGLRTCAARISTVASIKMDFFRRCFIQPLSRALKAIGVEIVTLAIADRRETFIKRLGSGCRDVRSGRLSKCPRIG